jgi:hypothetical protein
MNAIERLLYPLALNRDEVHQPVASLGLDLRVVGPSKTGWKTAAWR